jgi:hypothetical protein
VEASTVVRFVRGLLALTSLLIGLSVLALWGRSFLVGDEFRRGSDTRYVQVASADGELIVTARHEADEAGPLPGAWSHLTGRDPRDLLDGERVDGKSLWNRLGFGLDSQAVDVPTHGLVVTFMLPWWLVFLLVIPPAVRWAVRRHETAVAAARGMIDEPPLVCPTCGQMFGAVPPSCPFCGHILAAQQFF